MSVKENKREIVVGKQVYDVLRSGRAPEVSEIIRLINLAIKKGSDFPTKEPTLYRNDNVLSADHFNDFTDAVSTDIQALMVSVNQSWVHLEQTLADSGQLIKISRRADGIRKSALAILSTIKEADEVYLSHNVVFPEDIDFGFSEEIFIDDKAGTVSLQRAFSKKADPVGFDVKSWSLSSALGNPKYSTAGHPSLIFNPSSAQRFLVEAVDENEDIFHALSMSVNIASQASVAKRISSVTVDCGSIHDYVVTVRTTYDGENWEGLGQASGRHRVKVNGAARYVTDMIIEIAKTKSDGRRIISGKIKEIYAFDIEHVSIDEEAYVEDGELISGAIDIATDGVSSVVVNAETIEPNKASVELYVADEMEDATSIDDFAWKRVINGERHNIGNITTYSETRKISTASKIVDGIGATHDIWDIGAADNNIQNIWAGLDQVMVTTALASSPNAVSLSTSGPSGGAVSYKDEGLISLSGGYYYSIEMNIWSAYSDGVVANISMPTDMVASTDYLIVSNGRDITDQYDGERIPFGVSNGKNSLKVIIKTSTTNEFSVTVENSSVHNVSVLSPAFVAESKLSMADESVSADNGNIRTNFDPRGMRFLIVYADITPGLTSGKMRVRAKLTTEDGSITPIVKSLSVVSGG